MSSTRPQSSRPRRPVLSLGLDPSALARQILRTLHTPTTPLVASLLTQHHVNSTTLSSSPEDVISRLTAGIDDPCVRLDVSRHLQEVSTRIRPPSPVMSSSRRLPHARDIAQWLEEAVGVSEPEQPQDQPPSPAETLSPWDFRTAASTPFTELDSPIASLGSLILPTSAMGEPGSPHPPPSTPSDIGEPVAAAADYFPSTPSSTSGGASPIFPIFSPVDHLHGGEHELSPITPFHDHGEASGQGPYPETFIPEDDDKPLVPAEQLADSAPDSGSPMPTTGPPAPIEEPATESGPSVSAAEPTRSFELVAAEDLDMLMGLSDAMFVTLFHAVLDRTAGNNATTSVADGQPTLSSADCAALQRLVGLAEEGVASRRRDAGVQTDQIEAEGELEVPDLSSTDLGMEDAERYPGFISTSI